MAAYKGFPYCCAQNYCFFPYCPYILHFFRCIKVDVTANTVLFGGPQTREAVSNWTDIPFLPSAGKLIFAARLFKRWRTACSHFSRKSSILYSALLNVRSTVVDIRSTLRNIKYVRLFCQTQHRGKQHQYEWKMSIHIIKYWLGGDYSDEVFCSVVQ